MADDQQEPQPTQLTQPKQGEPIEIPVPKREDFERVVSRAALRRPRVADEAEDDGQAAEDH